MRSRKTIAIFAGAGRVAANIVTLATGAGMGAGLMYLYDPNRGRARRRKLVDRASGFLRHNERELHKHGKDFLNRVEGVVSEVSASLTSQEKISDDVLAARVRSRMGHMIEHPSDVNVYVTDGKVVLNGKLGRRDRARLCREIEAIPGVTRIDDRTARRPFFSPALIVGIAAGMTLLRKPSRTPSKVDRKN